MAIEVEVITALRALFGGLVASAFRGQQRIVVRREQVYDLLQLLKQRHGFDMLVDVTCVDYLHYRDASDRFGLIYLLANTSTAGRLTVRVLLNEPQLTVRSVTSLWAGADWMEREVWDMFGIHFDGHPDLRRILLPEEFTAHPLRKDYPLQGRGERHNFPVLARGEA